MEAKEELWLSGWQLPHTTTKGRVRVTSSNPPGKRHRPAFGVTVPDPLHARAAYVALKVKDPGCECLSSPAAAAGSQGAAPSQRRPLCRSRPRERAATEVATRRGSPRRAVGQGVHSPAQTSGGRGGWRPGAFRTPLSLPLLLAAGLLPSVWIR